LHFQYFEPKINQVSIGTQYHIRFFWGHFGIFSKAKLSGARAVRAMCCSFANPRRIRTDNGMTPLHLAVIEGRNDVIRLLLKYGAEKDKAGKR
jgi:ankyrin repeat protein